MINQKIVIIKGSPRKKGNSCTLADSLIKGATDNDAIIEEFFLHDMDIKPCNACDVCIKLPKKGCVIDDDMQIIYPSLRSADSIVIASPIYWFNISAQTKLFIDRLYGLINPNGHALKGKRIGIILTYGDTSLKASGGIHALNSYQDMFPYIGAKIEGIIHGSAMDAGQIKLNQKLMNDAYELGKRLSSSN